MTEQAEPSGPRRAARSGPYGPGFPPYPGRPPYGPPRDVDEVTVSLVANGWIVTAPAKNDDEDDYFSPETQRHVFQFHQKDSMIDFVGETTPVPKNDNDA